MDRSLKHNFLLLVSQSPSLQQSSLLPELMDHRPLQMVFSSPKRQQHRRFMTIEDVLEVVENETGQKVNRDTELKDLHLDSLEFLELLMRVGNIPDAAVPGLETVNDLYLASVSRAPELEYRSVETA